MLKTLGVVLFSVISASFRVAGTRQAPDLCHSPTQNDCPLREKRKLAKKNVHLFYNSPPQNIRVTHEKWHSFLICKHFHSSFLTTPKNQLVQNFTYLLGNRGTDWFAFRPATRLGSVTFPRFSLLCRDKQRHSSEFLVPSHCIMLCSLSYSKVAK